MSDTQVQPPGFYHLAQAGREGIHGKSLAAMLMQTFQHILDDFKAGMHQHINQTKYLDKLLHDVAKLTTLINEVSNPDVSISSLAQGIVSQGKVVEGDIGELANSVFKTELEKAFKGVMSLLQDKVQFTAIAKWYRDLTAFYKLIKNMVNGQFNADDAQQLVKIMKALDVDHSELQGKLKLIEQALGASSPLYKRYAQFLASVNAVWNPMAHDGGVVYTYLGDLIQDIGLDANKKQLLEDANTFITNIKNARTWGTHSHYMKEFYAFLDVMQTTLLEEKAQIPNFKLNLVDYLTLARKVMDPSNTKFQAAFPGIYDEMTSIEDGLDRMGVQGTSISEQTTTQFYQTMATVTALIKKISAMANIPIQIVNSEINNVTKRH